MKTAAVAGLATIALGSCSSLPGGSPGADKHDYAVTAGEVFGVAIGQSREQAKARLQADMSDLKFVHSLCRHESLSSDKSSPTYPDFEAAKCPEITEDVFQLKTTVPGYAHIRVDSRADRVVRIAWGRDQGRVR